MIANGETPITRAACTYSLFFSTITEPRTVRAYCTQKLRPMEKTSTESVVAPSSWPPPSPPGASTWGTAANSGLHR